MTRELRVTTQSFIGSSEDDCVLPPDDPIHQIKGAAMLGTATPALVAAAYNNKRITDIATENFKQRELAREQGIKPGTPAWYAMRQR